MPDAVGTPLFHRAMAFDYGDIERKELMRKVWSGTPWMVNVFIGGMSPDCDLEFRIRQWCRERFGPEAWPIHGHPGQWHRGSAIIHGWTWMGFATEAMLREFLAEWGPDQQETADA